MTIQWSLFGVGKELRDETIEGVYFSTLVIAIQGAV